MTGENNAVSSITILNDKILHSQSIGYRGRIAFTNAISKYQVNNPGGQNLRYNINKWKTQGIFDICYDISENFTLLQLMGSVGCVKHTVSILGYWIFDSK